VYGTFSCSLNVKKPSYKRKLNCFNPSINLKKCKRYVWKKYKAAFVLVSWTIASKKVFLLSIYFVCSVDPTWGKKRANSYMNPWISNDQGVGESMINSTYLKSMRTSLFVNFDDWYFLSILFYLLFLSQTKIW